METLNPALSIFYQSVLMGLEKKCHLQNELCLRLARFQSACDEKPSEYRIHSFYLLIRDSDCQCVGNGGFHWNPFKFRQGSFRLIIVYNNENIT